MTITGDSSEEIMASAMLTSKRKYQQEILKTINAFRASETLCDVVFLVENQRFPAHRVVMSAASSVFKAMFTSEVGQEKSCEEVKLLLFNTRSMTELLNFIYTAEVDVSESNASELLFAADYFDLPHLREACAEFLMAQLNPSNCLSIQSVAEKYNHKLLCKTAAEYIGNNLAAVLQADEFLTLDLTDVKELIRHERLLIKTQRGEENVFEGVRSWVKYDPENRKQYFEELLSYVRLSSMSPAFIREVVQREELVTQSLEAQNMATSALDIPDEKRDEPRCVTTGIVLLTDIGYASCYVPANEKWFDLARLPSFNTVRTVTICQDSVFAIGWEEDRLTVEKFDSRTNQWLEVLHTFTSRPMAAVTVGDRIFVLNAHGVVRFEPKDNSWTDVSPMNSVRWGLCAASLNGLVYAIGGHDSVKELGLNSVERYDPDTDQWCYVASMEEKRCYASVTTTDEKILVVGGTGECFLPLPNCELYEPITDEWSLLPARLYIPRSNAAIGKVKTKIFVFGGTFSNGNVECYDKETKTWSIVGKIPSTLAYRHGCVTLLPKALFRSLEGVKLQCCSDP